MEHVAETPAAEAEADKPRRRLRVPTSLVVTLVGAILTVLILPAVTRQWDDRQRAREVQVALTDSMAASSLTTIQKALLWELSGKRSEASFEPIAEGFYISSLHVESQLRAYFPGKPLRAWQRHRLHVVTWLRTVRFPPGSPPRHTGLPKRVVGIANASELNFIVPEIENSLVHKPPAYPLYTPRSDYRSTVSDVGNLIGLDEERVSDMVLAAAPKGFSTTRGDLIRDIVPGL